MHLPIGHCCALGLGVLALMPNKIEPAPYVLKNPGGFIIVWNECTHGTEFHI